MMDVFQAVEEQARRGSTSDKITAAALLFAASHRRDEIEAIRSERRIQRANSKREPTRNGALMTFELHALEYEACKIMCPDLQHAHWEAKKKAWQWILSQPWAEDFKPSEFEKRRF